MNILFPQNAITGMLFTDGATAETYVFDGVKWVSLGAHNHVVGHETLAIPLATTDEEENLEQTIEILRELNNSYKDEIQRLKAEVRLLSSDLHLLGRVGDGDPEEVAKYITALQGDLRRIHQNSALLPPRVQSILDKDHRDVVTVALPVTDRMQVSSIVDHMTASTNIHLVFKSSGGVFRHSTASLDALSKLDFPVQAISETFDAMAAALKKEFLDEVYKNSR